VIYSQFVDKLLTLNLMTATLWVLHGPNLNLLGSREPGIYGQTSLADINLAAVQLGQDSGVQIECFQSNHEGVLIDRIHEARARKVQFIVINPAAFTHTSVALRDALSGVAVPFIEVHLSNVHKRENFRHHSYFSDLAVAVIAGLGPEGYLAAIRYAIGELKGK
jgi:3-dehydroquinate dehydratase II